MLRLLPITVVALVAALPWAGRAWAGEIQLADKGQAKCVVVAPAGWAADAAPAKELPGEAATLLKARRSLFRDSIRDLALYLGKLSGTTVEIVEEMPAGERRVPVYVGAAAQKVFGPVGIS